MALQPSGGPCETPGLLALGVRVVDVGPSEALHRDGARPAGSPPKKKHCQKPKKMRRAFLRMFNEPTLFRGEQRPFNFAPPESSSRLFEQVAAERQSVTPGKDMDIASNRGPRPNELEPFFGGHL